MMRQKLISLVMLMLPISISAQEEKFDWNPVMDAIIQVESKGNPKAHNKNGDCAGILQITPGLVKQCNTWLKAKKSKKRYTLSDRYNVKKSKEMFVMVQKHYNKSNNVEKAIRVWNGGPGYTLEGTNGYYRKVMKYYKKKGAE
jgi:soluble lytic murein transglycosylase-like protein